MVVYNSNPAAIAPDQNAVLRGLAPRGSVHRGARAVPDRHRGLRRHPAAGRPPSWSTPTSTSPTGTTTCNWRGPRCPRPGEAKSNVEIFRAAGRSAWASTTPASRDTEDDMIRTLLDSPHPFLKGITLERLDREHSVRLQCRRRRRAVPAVRRRRLRHARRQVPLPRRDAGLHAAGGIASRRRGAARAGIRWN